MRGLVSASHPRTAALSERCVLLGHPPDERMLRLVDLQALAQSLRARAPDTLARAE